MRSSKGTGTLLPATATYLKPRAQVGQRVFKPMWVHELRPKKPWHSLATPSKLAASAIRSAAAAHLALQTLSLTGTQNTNIVFEGKRFLTVPAPHGQAMHQPLSRTDMTIEAASVPQSVYCHIQDGRSPLTAASSDMKFGSCSLFSRCWGTGGRSPCILYWFVTCPSYTTSLQSREQSVLSCLCLLNQHDPVQLTAACRLTSSYHKRSSAVRTLFSAASCASSATPAPQTHVARACRPQKV